MSIIIFSKPIHSGKTTELLDWSNKQQSIGGIIMPDIEGKRKMIDIRTKEVFSAECTNPENTKESLLNIGRYYFYSASFEKANSILYNEILLLPEWLIIDEVGKLEMEGKGFYQAVNKLVPYYQLTADNYKMLLVIRDSLLDPVLSFFKVKDPKVITSLF